MPPASLAYDSRDLALEIRALLTQIDPGQWRDEVVQTARARLTTIEERLARLLSAPWPGMDGLRRWLAEAQRVLQQYAPRGEGDPRAQWVHLYEQLEPVYEGLASSLREWDIHVPSLRPTNYARKVFHVFGGLITIGLVETLVYTPTRMQAVALSLAATTWFLEITRRIWPRWNDVLMALFGPLAHPHEHFRVNSGTWFVNALAALSLTGSVEVGVTAVAVLGFADPAAALIGRRWGRHDLVNGRTLEGSAAFVAVGFIAALAVLVLLHPGVALGTAVGMAGAAAGAGALAELAVRRIDDNFAIPVAAGFAAWLVSGAL